MLTLGNAGYLDSLIGGSWSCYFSSGPFANGGDSLQLLRRFYSEGLVDHRTFLTWLVQQMATCNLAQAGFVSKLADEYSEGMICSRALARHFADACLSRLLEVSFI